MANLDYAFLCDYATVTDGKLTAVGASYTHVITPERPAMHTLCIAGRVRALLDEDDPVALQFEIQAPNEQYRLTLQTELHRSEQARPYGNWVGLMFAATALIPLPAAGLYEVHVLVNSEHTRRLAFEYVVTPALES